MERTGEDGIALEKKSLHARERDTEANQQQRQTFLETLARRAPEKLMFLDESGVTTQMTRLHGRARAESGLLKLRRRATGKC